MQQRNDKSLSWTFPTQKKSSQFESRPFGVQAKQDSQTLSIQEEIEKQEKSSGLSHNFANIPVYHPDQKISPVQPKLVMQSNREVPYLSRAVNNGGIDLAQRMLQRRNTQSNLVSPIQAKLQIGKPNDKYEQEADRVASQVVQQLNSTSAQVNQTRSVQRQEETAEKLPAEPQISQLQRSPLSRGIQRKAIGHGEASIDLESAINQARGSGQHLDVGLQRSMGQVMGADFSGVRVHTDSQSDQLNQSIHAKAFTTGQDLFFKSGEYNPSSRSSQELIAHELTHVVQQNGAAIQRHPEKEEVQRKPDLQLHQEEEEVQPKPDLQRHPEKEEVQRKPDLQLHQEEEEVQRKPDLQRQELSNTCTTGCQCTNCTPTVQRQMNFSNLSGQNLLNRKLMDLVQPQDAQIQRDADSNVHSESCSCPNCGNVRTQIQPKSETKHGSGCSCSMCSNKREPIQTKLMVQRHQEEEIAQTKPLGNSITPTIQQSANPDVIQRHSSWEHQLLGDAKPNDLAKIGVWQELIEETKKVGMLGFRKPAKEKAEITIEGVGTINKGNVMHVIAQELDRLDAWQAKPPQEGTSGEIDSKYQTVLVSIPGGGKDGKSPLIITYGEMNTLADYYGSLDVMKSADPKVRWEVIQSVRKETFLRLSGIYEKLKDSLTDTEKEDDDVKISEEMMRLNKTEQTRLNRNKFADANEPDFISAKAGQIDLLLTGAGATRENEYKATLARNACHFVPESWHAWSSYHQKARDEAQKSWDLQKQAQSDLDEVKSIQSEMEFGSFEGEDSSEEIQSQIEELNTQAQEKKEQAKEPANEAILNNGFGDHYLQDSYAAGHMINKTRIMQWFVQWLDQQKWKMDFASEDNWRKVQAIAYNQPELASAMQYDKSQIEGYDEDQTTTKAKNPQAIEDIEGDDWQVRFNALGLRVPASLQTPGTPSRTLIEWWQSQTLDDEKKRELSGETLFSNNGQLDFNSVKLALKGLIKDGIVYPTSSGFMDTTKNLLVDDYSAAKSGVKYLGKDDGFDTSIKEESFKSLKFELKAEYVPKNLGHFLEARRKSQKGDDSAYQKMAAAVTYQDYMAFMNNAYVQKSTNALHDVFCLNGLEVSSGSGAALFKVYGDDSMFNKESAKGVKHSGETAKMSRDAIRNIIKTGADGGITTASILSRLPSQVKLKDNPSMSIEDWHDPSRVDGLKKYCDGIFANMGALDKGAGATGDLTKFISKDKAKVHGADAF